jgi:hypothetical protein
MMANYTFSGGAKLQEVLKKLAAKAEADKLLKVGFFEGATENENGAATPMVAYVNEFGGAVVGAVDADGMDDSGNKVQNRPPRPFFRRMISLGEKHWGKDLGAMLQYHNLEANAALSELGTQMKDELVDSIAARVYAPLSPKTIARKGNDQTLIDSGDMQNAVDFQID